MGEKTNSPTAQKQEKYAMKARYRTTIAVFVSLMLLLQAVIPALAADITPGNPQGWQFRLESGTNGSGQFVTGPGTPPAGSGSAQLVVTNSDTGSVLGLAEYGGTRLADISAMTYWTYQTSRSSSALAISLQLNVDFDLTDSNTSWQGRLVFEPHHNGSPGDATWEQWDAIDSGGATWWASGFHQGHVHKASPVPGVTS